MAPACGGGPASGRPAALPSRAEALGRLPGWLLTAAGTAYRGPASLFSFRAAALHMRSLSYPRRPRLPYRHPAKEADRAAAVSAIEAEAHDATAVARLAAARRGASPSADGARNDIVEDLRRRAVAALAAAVRAVKGDGPARTCHLAVEGINWVTGTGAAGCSRLWLPVIGQAVHCCASCMSQAHAPYV